MASARSLLGVKDSEARIDQSVLVIVDAQNEYADGHLKIVDVDKSRKIIKDLLERYRATKAPIVHIVHRVPDGAPIFTPGTALADEFAELAPQDGEKTLDKQHPGSFTGTDLDEVIKATGRKQVVLVGYMAHVCISTTARQASERGYDTVVVRDAIGDRDIPGLGAAQAVHAVLAELGDFFATIVDAKEVVG